MALIERFHVIADHYNVAAGEEIIEGMIVTLNSSGEVVLATGASGEIALGIAGDTKSTSVSGLPTTNAASLGAGGVDQSFINRVSDTFDETKASGRITVYHTGGSFATNQFAALSYSVNDPLYVASTGKLTNVASTSNQIIGYVTKAQSPYDSGVPGIDVNGSMALVGNYIEFKLAI
jgi:hypothetical protein